MFAQIGRDLAVHVLGQILLDPLEDPGRVLEVLARGFKALAAAVVVVKAAAGAVAVAAKGLDLTLAMAAVAGGAAGVRSSWTASADSRASQCTRAAARSSPVWRGEIRAECVTLSEEKFEL